LATGTEYSQKTWLHTRSRALKLYELTKMLTELEAELDNIVDVTDGQSVIKDEIYSRLDQFGVQFEFKAGQIGKMVLNYESDMAQLKAEEDRLAARRKVISNRVDHLKKYLLGCMKELGIKTVNYETVRVMIQDNPYSVGEVSLPDLPAEFVRIIPELKEPDKKKILEHFKETGEIPDGVSEISRSQRLIIK
jgi:hypothetical protein